MPSSVPCPLRNRHAPRIFVRSPAYPGRKCRFDDEFEEQEGPRAEGRSPAEGDAPSRSPTPASSRNVSRDRARLDVTSVPPTSSCRSHAMSSSQPPSPPIPGLTRRGLLRQAGAAAGGAAVAGAGGQQAHEDADREAPEEPRIAVPTPQSLGVEPIINCWGGQTTLGGNLMPPEVLAAMEAASRSYLVIDELMDGVGKRLGELTGAEWGFVSSGATAAMCAATCACLAGTDQERMDRLPDTSGMKNEVVVPASHRHHYDRGITMTGVTMVEVDSIAELEASVGERTCMIALLGAFLDRPDFPLEEIVRIGKTKGVPVAVDAAAEEPTSPDRYIEAGVDLVAYSAGKCIRGPQCAGFLLGREDLTRAAYAQMSPHLNFGRAMKVGKEEIMGALTALDLWLNGRDHEAERVEYFRKIAYIRKELEDIEGLRLAYRPTRTRANIAPRLMIEWDHAARGKTALEVHHEMLAGTPRIFVRVAGSVLFVHPMMLEPGDEVHVARRLHEVLAV